MLVHLKMLLNEAILTLWVGEHYSCQKEKLSRFDKLYISLKQELLVVRGYKTR